MCSLLVSYNFNTMYRHMDAACLFILTYVIQVNTFVDNAFHQLVIACTLIRVNSDVFGVWPSNANNSILLVCVSENYS
jgi:hypothetical protein